MSQITCQKRNMQSKREGYVTNMIMRTKYLSHRLLKATKAKAERMSGHIWICYSCDHLKTSETDLRAHIEEMHNGTIQNIYIVYRVTF